MNNRVKPGWLPSTQSLAAIYFVFGLSMMAWIPRFAEIKQGLGLASAQFGFLISLSFFGSLGANLFMGHVAHRIGSKRMIQVGATAVYVVIGLQTHAHTALQLGAISVALGFAVTSFNIGLNSQSLLVQHREGRSVLGSLHGSWAFGSLVTGLIASVIASQVSPQLHVTTLAIIGLPITLWLSSELIPLDEDHHASETNTFDIVPPLWRSPRLTWLLAAGAAGGSMFEFANADWSAIYATEELGVPIGPHAMLFTISMVAMVIGRFMMDPVVSRVGMQRLVTISTWLITIGLLFGIWASQWASQNSVSMALAFACIGFFIAGLGSAPIVPAFYGMAHMVNGVPVSVTLARLSLAHNLFGWLLKVLVAGVVGLVGLAWGYMIPALTAAVAGLVIAHLYDHHFVGHDDRKPLVADAPQ